MKEKLVYISEDWIQFPTREACVEHEQALAKIRKLTQEKLVLQQALLSRDPEPKEDPPVIPFKYPDVYSPRDANNRFGMDFDHLTVHVIHCPVTEMYYERYKNGACMITLAGIRMPGTEKEVIAYAREYYYANEPAHS